jgi:hypothetical protein
MRAFLLPAVVVLLAGCAAEPPIRQFGAMRPVMREGLTEPRIELAAVASAGTFGVGAMAGLDGEVTIDDGRVLVTRVAPAGPVTTGPAPCPAGHATLLTVGRPSRWHDRELRGSLAGSALEDAIRDFAASRSIRTDAPFLFTIETTAATASMHVIAGACPHANPDAEVFRVALKPGTPTRVVGVYAEGRAGELTHHGARIHAHAIFEYEGRTITAHVDELGLADGGTLRVGQGPP